MPCCVRAVPLPVISDETELELLIPYKTINSNELVRNQPLHIKIFLLELGYVKIKDA
jgi:hypothetical protein